MLICISLSIVLRWPRQKIYWEPDNSKIKDMVQHLNQSPLFPDGIDVNELSTTLSSLELLFSCEDDRVNLFLSRADATDGLEHKTETRKVHTWSYEYQVLQMRNIERNAFDGARPYLEVDVEPFEKSNMNRHVFKEREYCI